MWQLIYGAATDSEATVYARWLGAPTDVDLSRRLTLQGPYCSLSRTLRASFVMRRESERLWKTTVTDPCFWSAELPARYGLKIGDRRTSIVEMGIRRFGGRGSDLYLNGRRWVFRAIDTGGAPKAPWDSIREAMLSVIVRGEVDQLAAVASERGVMLAISTDTFEPSCVMRWSRWPAVAMLILPSRVDIDRDQFKAQVPNLLLGCEVVASTEKLPTWADVYFASNDAKILRRVRTEAPEQPLIAVHESPEEWKDATVARRSCEQLQASLAPDFDLSGYVVRFV